MATQTSVQYRSQAQKIRAEIQEQLQKTGYDVQKIDKLLALTSLDEILTKPVLAQYLRNNYAAYLALVSWENHAVAVRADVAPIEQYQEFFEVRSELPRVAGKDMIPPDLLFQPARLAREAGFTEQQAKAYQWLLSHNSEAFDSSAQREKKQRRLGSSGKALAAATSAGPGQTSYDKALGTGGWQPPPPVAGDYGDAEGLSGISMQEAKTWVDENLGGTTSYFWFQALFNRQDWVTNIYIENMQELERLRQARRKLGESMANADPREVFLLQQEMQDISGMEQRIVDKMMRAQHFMNEFISMVKSLKEIAGEAKKTIISNIGR